MKWFKKYGKPGREENMYYEQRPKIRLERVQEKRNHYLQMDFDLLRTFAANIFQQM